MMRFQFGIAAMNVRDEPNKGGDHLRQGGNHLAFANSLHPWFRAASGHGLFLSKEIRDRYPDSFWFTILREPRARYLSHFTYLAEKKGLQTKLDDWVGQGNMKNIQTRWLAGEPNLDKAIEAMETLFDFVGRLDQIGRAHV